MVTPRLSEEVLDYAGQQMVQDDVDRKDFLISKTGWKWGHPKHTHADKEVPTKQHGRQSSHTSFEKSAQLGAPLCFQMWNKQEQCFSMQLHRYDLIGIMEMW